MSIVNISMDTSDKKLTVEIDGKKIDNAKFAYLYDGDGVEIAMREDMGDMKKMTRIVGENSDKGKELLSKGCLKSSRYEDFIIV